MFLFSFSKTNPRRLHSSIPPVLLSGFRAADAFLFQTRYQSRQRNGVSGGAQRRQLANAETGKKGARRRGSDSDLSLARE
jgi:hypothetical protein